VNKFSVRNKSEQIFRKEKSAGFLEGLKVNRLLEGIELNRFSRRNISEEVFRKK
jgi:hypothetical protein